MFKTSLVCICIVCFFSLILCILAPTFISKYRKNQQFYHPYLLLSTLAVHAVSLFPRVPGQADIERKQYTWVSHEGVYEQISPSLVSCSSTSFSLALASEAWQVLSSLTVLFAQEGHEESQPRARLEFHCRALVASQIFVMGFSRPGEVGLTLVSVIGLC